MKQATPIKDVYVPELIQSCDGVLWMSFRYTEDDRDPWKWPKVMECDGIVYKWMSWNSDTHKVHYKQIDRNSLARKSK